MPLWLTEKDVRAVLPLGDLAEAMETALAFFSLGRVRQPVRGVVEVGPGGDFFGAMPAYLEPTGALGAKLVTVFAKNHERGLPTHLATILYFDSATGALLAAMDGRFITEARTAAVSAVSVRFMARPDARTLAILGAGVQARSHVEALRGVRDFTSVRAWSPTPANLKRFADETGAEACASAAEAVRGADVIVVATSSRTPVIEDAWVAPGAHIAAVGACRPDQREIDPALAARARLVVDSRQAALEEAGDVILAIAEGRFGADRIAGELGEVISGAVPGRTSPEEITLFKSLGLAVEDVACARLAYERALARGIGTVLP